MNLVNQIDCHRDSEQIFYGGIDHPDLYLWDAWSYTENQRTHLYCLAVSRYKEDGRPLAPSERNQTYFHIRHFVSIDTGVTWIDQGVFQISAQAKDGHDVRNIWSGSVMPIPSGKVIAAYTGIHEGDDEHPFLQNLAVGFSLTGDKFQYDSAQVLLCPKRDEDWLRSMGYYFAADDLGSCYGEEGGPILAFRDPYVFNWNEQEQSFSVVWAAKSSSNQPAMGIADVEISSGVFRVKCLYPPVQVPDGHLFTQLEVPKIYYDAIRKRYLLIIASSTRQSETQPDHEVRKSIRMYYAKELMGPWQLAGSSSSEIENLDCLFGMTVLDFDQKNQSLIGIAPYTEMASEEKMLTFADRFSIDLSQLGEAEKLCASSMV